MPSCRTAWDVKAGATEALSRESGRGTYQQAQATPWQRQTPSDA